MPIDYGIQSEYTSSDTELFTEVDNQLKLATERATYQPYFEMFQQSATTEYFNNLQKQGTTGQGQATGFAGSTATGGAGSAQSGSFMDALMQGFGSQIFKVEEDITKKQAMAQGSINDIIQSNRQTALSLKQLEEGNKGGDSCFDENTLILMSDGTERIIKNVKVGDKVIGYTGDINTVTHVECNPLGERDLYGFGKEHWFTAEHPFLTSDGWKSLSPANTKKENTSFNNISKMQVGDKLFIGSKIADKVGYIHIPIVMLNVMKRSNFETNKMVYNLLTDGNHTYHANSYVVHSIQPNFDALYVKNGLEGLKDEEKEILFKAVSTSSSPERLLEVLGKAWGVSVPLAFKQVMETINITEK